MRNPSSIFRRALKLFTAGVICLFTFILFSAFRQTTTGYAQEEIAPPSAILFSENFDGVTAPALPAGWTTATTGGALNFATSIDHAQTTPNSAFARDPNTPSTGISEIISPPILLPNSPSQLIFRHAYYTVGNYDGCVLEMKTGGGQWQDIIAAGGEFTANGYFGPINGDFSNPLSGRLAWFGRSSSGDNGETTPPNFVLTRVMMPAAAAGQSVQFRWRLGLSAVGITNFAGGWWLDDMTVETISPTAPGYVENFDAVTAPGLPLNWTTAQTGSGALFVTQTVSPDTPPNAVFTTDPSSVGSAEIVSPPIRVGGNSPKLIFRHLFNTERSFDGGMVEIKIGNGAFADILSAGGSFVQNGYNTTLSNTSGNPLGGRMAWSGVSGTGSGQYVTTEINLPAAAFRQTVQFRWRFGSDSSIAGVGWRIDTVQVTNAISGENTGAISIPASGTAQPYPSEIQVSNHDGLITAVQVNLQNFTHSSPDDVDLILVSPAGRKVVLMSDVGGSSPVTDLSLSFDDAATASLPDNAPLVSGNFRPTNFEPNDAFPAPAPDGAPTGTMLAAFNGSQANGAWKLFLVDDNGNNTGNISGGWSLAVQTAPDVTVIPASGTAMPYPSELIVNGQQGSVSKVTVTLTNFSHTAPDDVDIMLVAPNGRRIVLMSDVGGNTEVGGLNLTFDDDASANAPDNAALMSGTYKPTNFEAGDAFPAPAPQGAPTSAALTAFYGSAPNGTWRLFVTDDTGENLGSIAGGWSLNIQSSVGACSFNLSSTGQAFPINGGNGGFTVQMPAGCPWTASSNSSFITLTSGANGEGDGAVGFSVAPNTGGGRTGSIIVTNGVSSLTFLVQQPSGCPFAVGQSTINFPSAGGNGNVSVTAGSGCGWQASSNASWIFITSAPQTGDGTVSFNVQQNTGPNPRTGSITVGARTIIVNQVGSDSILASKRFDFDGDGRADISVFRSGSWYLQQSTAGFVGRQFGLTTDKLVPADYDGDRKTDLAVYRDGSWYILQSSDGAFRAIQFGLATDKPAPADYTGDGRADLGVYRSGIWFTLDLTNSQTAGVQFGISTDKPVVGDYDGDGRADFAVYRDGAWYLLRSQQGFISIQFGVATDKPVVGDYDGDGKSDFAVYRDGIWYLLQSVNGFSATQFGLAGDTPVSADYDGDGKNDLGVFRNGAWYLLRSQQGFTALQFGQSGDAPVPAAFVP